MPANLLARIPIFTELPDDELDRLFAAPAVSVHASVHNEAGSGVSAVRRQAL
jgi:hypothetical protein